MKPFLNISIFFCIMLAAVGGTTAGKPEVKSAKILIHITGFDHTDGVAKVALVNSKANYESDGEPYMGFNYKIIDNEVVQTIVAPYGEYAVKVFHDENGNDKMDTRIFGIPTERYGFSNNARGTFGPPDYEDASFTLDAPGKKLMIRVQ